MRPSRRETRRNDEGHARLFRLRDGKPLEFVVARPQTSLIVMTLPTWTYVSFRMNALTPQMIVDLTDMARDSRIHDGDDSLADRCRVA